MRRPSPLPRSTALQIPRSLRRLVGHGQPAARGLWAPRRGWFAKMPAAFPLARSPTISAATRRSLHIELATAAMQSSAPLGTQDRALRARERALETTTRLRLYGAWSGR